MEIPLCLSSTITFVGSEKPFFRNSPYFRAMAACRQKSQRNGVFLTARLFAHATLHE
ncbi:MAG: hypothetical protein Q7T80_05650 [Methanoregula sp.]|nr:hypothetical protein [Methanoregula sp.]